MDSWFGVFSAWSLASIVSGPELSQKEYQNREHGRNKAAPLLEERAERGHGPETKYTLEGCVPSDLHPTVRPLLQCPAPSNSPPG